MSNDYSRVYTKRKHAKNLAIATYSFLIFMLGIFAADELSGDNSKNDELLLLVSLISTGFAQISLNKAQNELISYQGNMITEYRSKDESLKEYDF